MFKKIRTILVEDEPLAIKGLLKYIQNNKFIELVAVCENAAEVYEAFNSQNVELVFLDISMPKIAGSDLLPSEKGPITIITSAIPPSTRNTDNDWIYLTKPVSAESFAAAVSKVYDKVR